MLKPVETIWKFINYWYFRYLLVTELFMVEKWERIAIHSIFLIAFTCFFVLNVKIVLPLIDSTVHNMKAVT